MFSNTFAVAGRVLHQLRRDRRFIAISLVMPAITIYMLSLFFEGVDTPFVNPKTFVVPVGAFLVHFITYALCAIVLVRERTGQTLARMFINGYRQIEIIGGYLLAYSLLSTLQSLIVMLMMHLLFDLTYTLEVYAAVYIVTWILAQLSIALGMFVSNFARNEGQVFPMIPLVILISVFFSGMLLPIDRLPEAIQWARFFTPMYYANEGIQQIIKSGSTFSAALGALAGLVVYGVLLLGAATLTLREGE